MAWYYVNSANHNDKCKKLIRLGVSYGMPIVSTLENWPCYTLNDIWMYNVVGSHWISPHGKGI